MDLHMIKKDYYMILGVPRTESQRGIRAAFRELARRYHPERVGGRAMRFFQDIVNAYQVLSNTEKRKLYDQGLSHAEGGSRQRGDAIIIDVGLPAESTVPECVPLLRAFETVSPPFERLLVQVLRSFTHVEEAREESIATFNIQVLLSPDEAVHGGTGQVTIPVFYPCDACGGTGHDGFFSCLSCQAQGVIEEEEAIRIQIPPLVHDYSVIEAPVRGLGLHNICVRLYICVTP
jgi:DnaJ-class molecular chaperone